ncbi:MAG: hypothetical protein KKE86_04170, partial [Planctomycetes bacterium]|nr:hypothetical protein [Planctomycetota bacterium]
MSQSSMTPEPDRLIAKLLEGDLPETEREQLNRLLRDDASLRRLYREYMILDALLRWEIAPPLMRVGEEGCGTRGRRRGVAGSPATDASVGPTVEHPVGAAVELPHQHNVELPHHLDLESQIPNPPFPLLTTTHYPLPADFVGSWTFACMVATVIVGAMLLGFWAIKITPHQHIAEAPSKSVPSIKRPEFVFVGRITGLLDVKWSDDKDFLPPHGYAYVPLGHKY